VEGFLEALGTIGLILLIVVGLLAGWIASAIAGGRHRTRYLVAGVLAALATPFLLAAIGVGVLAAGGLLVILLAAAVGAVLVLLLARAIFD
jgi:uncharacterized membrane protein YeaQ/YmgE (transglycosylase-associated protein family)